MAKQVINVEGEDQVVREDTAKSFRGTYWALASVAAFIIITALLFFSGIITRVANRAADPADASAGYPTR